MEDQEELDSPPGPPKMKPPSLPPPLPARPPKSVEISQQAFEESTNEGADLYEDVSAQMTASYSEISNRSDSENDCSSIIASEPIIPERINQRPATLSCDISEINHQFGPLDLEGTVHVEGNMTHFVAEDLEYKIKISSPNIKKGETPTLPGATSRSGTPNKLYRQLLVPQVNQIDIGLLNDLESEAQHVATSIDNLTENLCEILHSISSITADNVDVYKNAVSKMSDAMDGNIKSMYTMMAKAEEVTQAMKSVQQQATRIKEIKRLVDLFESYV